MKVLVHNLQGFALDYAVATVVWSHLCPSVADLKAIALRNRYSSDPSVAYSIILHEGIATERGGEGWQATYAFFDKASVRYNGTDLLIAAMRCFVAKHVGLEVEIPAEFR